jgi:hypothetical protein
MASSAKARFALTTEEDGEHPMFVIEKNDERIRRGQYSIKLSFSIGRFIFIFKVSNILIVNIQNLYII